ncbi:hypothetical protein AB0L62_07755 [Nocardia asteroides]|uniref:hypothetical protein n=1 Tax=Nocardia asteroides TaxID=1824 RepID=UPI003418C7E0
MADTVSRSEFDLAAHFGVAGPATDLTPATIQRWRERDPDWKAKHWAYTEPDQHRARHLRPINLTTRTKTQN